MIKDCKDSPDAYPFDDLIIEMFESGEDLEKLYEIGAFITKNKEDYCVLHLVTLANCYRGYVEEAKITEIRRLRKG